MIKFLQSLARRLGPTYATQPVPDQPFYAIGDIHGRDDLLRGLIDQIHWDATQRGHAPTIVFLGDMVDRGPAASQVLATVRDHIETYPGSTALAGNHEEMLLEFLDDPADTGMRWLKHGGLETLNSFGIDALRGDLDVDALLAVSDALMEALGNDRPGSTMHWLRNLPTQWVSGNLHCVHAGMDPDRAPDSQPRSVLLWGCPTFLRQTRTDGVWVVHGHTVVPDPVAASGRISIDTGAYRSGVLTAAAIDPTGDVRFLQETV